LLSGYDHGITAGVEPENQAQAVHRIRFVFAKDGPARYISHLDLARAVERALNRASLPVAYSQGFNRRPRLSVAAALPLGYTSEAEIADVWFTAPVAPEMFIEQLSAKMPPGIRVLSANAVALSTPSLQQLMAESVYVVDFLEVVNESALHAAVEELLAAEVLLRERVRAKGGRSQIIDLRPLILAARAGRSEDGRPQLMLRLVQTATQTGRPDDVLAALGFDPLDLRVHRIELLLADPNQPLT
jgi:radical SAM-linked protein